jgi:hypothetical protein
MNKDDTIRLNFQHWNSIITKMDKGRNGWSSTTGKSQAQMPPARFQKKSTQFRLAAGNFFTRLIYFWMAGLLIEKRKFKSCIGFQNCCPWQ